METVESGVRKEQVFAAVKENDENLNLPCKKDNVTSYQNCFKCFPDFSSGDECSTTYELKMENTIVEQNDTIMALHEELEVKNRDIIVFQDELTRKNSLIQEMKETILAQNESIERLQDELNVRTNSINDVQKILRERDDHIQENEKIILNLNETSAFLECELENKNKFILELKEEIKKKESLIEEMNNSLTSKNNVICILQNDIEIKDDNIRQIEEVILRTKATIEEAEGLKLQVSDLTNQVKGLEEALRVKNEAIQRSNEWHIEMKKEFEAQSASAIEREGNLKFEYDKDIEKLKDEFHEQFKLVGEKKSLLESFLENQVGILLNKLLELSGKGYGNKKEVETFKRLYEEELKKEKFTVLQFSGNVHTEQFIKQLEEFNKTLATCFFHEEAMKGELFMKTEELRKLQDELKQSKKMCDDVMSNEKQLFTKLTKTEIELNLIKDEKAQLQQRLTEANNNYEKVTIEFNRERVEIEKKYRQALDSYETDLIILNKSLQELLCNIPSNFDSDISFLGSGDSSLVSLNSDVNSMISNPNIYNGQKIVTKCLYELGKLRNEMKRISHENKAVRLALEVRSKTCEEKDEELKKLNAELELIRNKYSTIEEEKKYLENKLKYMIEENNNLNMNIELLNFKISELNDDMKKYQEEILLLKKSEEETKSKLELGNVPNALNLSPIVNDRFGVRGGSDTLLVTGELRTPDISFQSLPGATVRDINVYTSTPFCRLPCDLEGGGELTQTQINKPHLDFQVSLLKWMEKCQQLDKENKALTMQVQDLELLNQELKCSMRCVKEEMDIFKEKQRNLEKKLNSFISMKKQLITLHDENDLKEQRINNLMKELDNLTSENTELFHKNLELEEIYRKHVSKLTEIKHIQDIGAFTDSITNSFNEKIKEIIQLKEEISSLKDEKKMLVHKVDLLIESNNNYVSKLNNMVDKLCISEEELEKIANEKLEVFSNNKLLKKEIELLQQRVDYLSSLRDSHWCNPSSIQLFEDMQKEVLEIFRNSFESKFESQYSTRCKNVEKDKEKCDPLNLPEVLKMLSQQLKDEKADFEQKSIEFQTIIHSMKDGNALSDVWFVQMDKMLRNILEELKYHKEQYYRIEEALRCTGKFHDELQKQKDELRIKEHEIASLQKKWEEEKIKSRKSEGHLKMLEEDIVEKNEFIKALIDEMDKMEQDILELQKKASDNEVKYETNVKSLEWKTKLEELRKSKQEIDNKIAVMQNVENEMENRGSLAKDLEEAELIYLKAVDEVKLILQAETSNSIVHIQEEHKEQVEQLQRVISEQAIRIGFLLKRSSLNVKESEDSDPDVLFINEDLQKQFDLAVYALQQLHQEEQQLLRLQLEAEKYNEIYEATHMKVQKTCKMTDMHSTQSRDLEKILVQKFESVLQHDFINRLKTFLAYWHCLYTDEISQVEDTILKSVEDCIKLIKEGKGSERDKTEETVNNFICQYSVAIESAKGFIHGLKEEYNSIKNSLNSIIKMYINATLDCFEKIKLAHSHVNDSLELKEKLDSLMKEKEELEKMHKNAIELLHADHKTEEEKIQVILTEIKKCCESGCDPNTWLKIKDDLEEKHKKELEVLRTYYVQMCANMEKQYSEDVNSLHSRMLSLSSSCSDDIISDQVLSEKGGSGDHVGNIILSELLPENDVALDNLAPDTMKFIEEPYYKWSEEVKEMKRELEQKYTKKIEQLQDRLSTFIYNNELDLSVRCIKDEVMRDCKSEIENIEKEISSRMLPYHDDIESLKSDNECPSLGKDIWRYSSCESDFLWEQLVDLLGNFATKDTLNKVTKELALSALRNVSEIQQDNLWKLSQFFKLVDNSLFTIEFKVKEKENQLLSLQNKLNSFSQVVLRLASKLRLSVQETKERNDLFNNTIQLEQMLEGGYNKELCPPELAKICNIFKNKFEKMLILEKEKYRKEIENEKKMLEKEKENLERSFESDLSKRPSVDEFHRLLSERDSLKQMTLTLKSAVSQLVSYLNTCEDELNKTVVDELLKICDETPRKGLEFMEQDNSPGFRRVHFAPEVGMSDLDESEDLSSILRLQLDSCLSKLKLEAASLLGLTALQPPPANLNKQIENLRKENEELLNEISDLKLRLEKNQCDSLELREQLFSDSNKENGSTFLQDKAQCMMNNAQRVPPETAKLLEDLAKFGDKLINELQKERIDLQQQIDAADKQLKSTRQFLEEQAVERESERDEYAKEVSRLQNQLKECGKNWTSHERFTTEVEELELQLKEANAHLEETEKRKELIEGELKDAIDKVWVLRDIISDLEAQLNTKSEKEALLERKLNELEAELDEQNGTQYAMAQELESLRSQSMDDGYLEQIKQLQENIKVQFNSSVVRQMKSQLRDMEKGIEHRIKELETLFLTNSTTSLSSPSEEVSLREQLEWSRCRTPEQCPSPVALPVEEITRLQEKLHKHSRAEEVLIKRLKDQQLTSAKLSAEIEEMHAERDVMQLQLKKQMVQLAESNNKIDDLRHKVETAQTAANKDLISQVQDFKEKYSLAERALDSMQNQLLECKEQLVHAEEIINKQKVEIRNLAHCDHEIVDSLRLELAAVTAERNKLEELFDKYKRDFNIDVMNALLVDKNEDIDHLQHTVTLLQNQEDEEKHGSCNSKGYRVSFATDIEDSSTLSEGMRLRDAPQSNSLEIMTENIQVFGGPISPIACNKDGNLEYSLHENLSLFPSIIPASIDHSEDNTKLLLNNLKVELKEKTDHILLLEKEVECLKTIEDDLRNTKSELELVLSSVSEDKQFYEKQLQSLQEKVSSKDEEIQKLKKVLFTKDEEIIKTTADVQALREISLSLQEKLKEATALVESENNSILKEELARLTLEIKKRDEKIQTLENELLAYKNDLADEKELSETLKSSLNIVAKEKLLVEEKLETIKIENSNLLNALRTVEDNFEHYVTAVRNLKNELFSQTAAYGPVESNFDPKLVKDNFEESEVLKLKQEIIKLLELNEKFRTEREIFIKEINELKSTLTSNDYAIKDSTINHLQDELKDLQKVVIAIKEEKLEVFANFSAEINKLQQNINQLQESKQEAVEKWKNELSEKESLQKRLESIQMELQCEKEQNENQRQQVFSRAKKLSFCDVNVLDIPPVSYIPAGLDALAEKMRKEIKLSASLDNSLLETILPDNNEPLELENIPQEKTIVQLDHKTCFSKIRSLERALMEEIEKAREGKRAQREKENECQALETEKYNLKLHIDRLGRLLSTQNEKINQLLSQVESQKEKIITLELSVLKEQTSTKQISSCLEEERSKAREAQREDITLIETMRQRLQNLMENEIKLKKMVIDERQKSENLVAQLNSIHALEKYRSDSDDENQKHVKKIILNEREKYLALKVEYEKEKRTCEDLREVLARERTALLLQRDNLSKSERIRSQIEKEMSVLKKQLNEELLKRQIAESKIVEVQDNVDSKFQKHLQSLENKNKKSLDAAYSVIRELEQEYNDLKQYLRNQQEQDDNWKENVHAPLIQQLNEVNDNLDTLVKERVDLKRTIERLNDENTRLHNLISDLRMVSSRRDSTAISPSMSLQSPQTQLKALETVMPFLEREIDNMLHCALHAEHHRKALAFQKRYLLVALRGYQDAHSQTVLRLQGIYHLRPRPFTRISFRSVALAVIAAHKLIKLPLKRLIRYNNKKEILLQSLKTSLSRSTAEAERLASVPLVRQPAPHSPPSRDRAIQRYR